MGLVAPVEDQHVAVGILDEAHVAHAAVSDSHDLRAGGTKLLDGRLDVGYAERNPIFVRDEGDVLLLRFPELQRDVRDLEVVGAIGVRREPQRVAVEALGPLEITGRDRNVVDALDLHHGSEPSRYGAYRWWRIRELPSASRKNAMWQTPESYGSGNANCTPASCSRSIVFATSATRSAIPYSAR